MSSTISLAEVDLPQPFILTLGNLKGGVGKTTTAFFLAAYFALEHEPADPDKRRRVLIIDADPLSQTGYSWHKKLRQGNVPVPFDVIAFPSVHIGDCIAEHRDDYDVIIVDAGGESADILEAAIVHSDEVLLLAGATWADMDRIPSTFKAAKRATAELTRVIGVRVLMTKCPVTMRGGKNVSSEYLLHRGRCEESGYEVIEQYVSNWKWYRESADAPVGRGAENPLEDRGEYVAIGDEIVAVYLPEEQEVNA